MAKKTNEARPSSAFTEEDFLAGLAFARAHGTTAADEAEHGTTIEEWVGAEELIPLTPELAQALDAALAQGNRSAAVKTRKDRTKPPARATHSRAEIREAHLAKREALRKAHHAKLEAIAREQLALKKEIMDVKERMDRLQPPRREVPKGA